MVELTRRAAEVFRDYATDGVPASGVHQPLKTHIREWGAALESALTSIAAQSPTGVLETLLAGSVASVPSDVTSLEFGADEVVDLLANFHLIEAAGDLDVVLPAGDFEFSGAAIARVSHRSANIRLLGATPIETTLTGCSSVSGSAGAFSVTLQIGSTAGIVPGMVAKIWNAGPLPHLSGDNSILLRRRPAPNELGMPTANLGYASITAGSNVMTFSGPLEVPLTQLFAAGDLAHMAGQTNPVQSVGASTVTFVNNWTRTFTGTRALWTSRANSGTISTSGSNTSINGAGTAFSTEGGGGQILVANGEMREILSVGSSASMVVDRAITLPAGTPYSIITPATLHEGAHVITAVGTGTITVLNTSRRAPPTRGVSSGSVSILRTRLRMTGAGDGTLAGHGANLRWSNNIAWIGNGTNADSQGVAGAGRYPEGFAQTGAVSHLNFGDKTAWIGWGHGVVAGIGCDIQARGAAASGNLGFGCWFLEQSTANIRNFVASGNGSNGIQANAGSTVLGTEGRGIGNGGDGWRLENGAVAYCELPFFAGNVGMGFRGVAAEVHINEFVSMLNGASGFRAEGGEGEALRGLVACNKREGFDFVEDADFDISEGWATGTSNAAGTGAGVYLDTALVTMDRLVTTGNVFGLYSEKRGIVDGESVWYSGAQAVRAGRGSVFNIPSNNFGGGTVISTGGRAEVHIKGYSNLGGFSPGTLGRPDADGNLVSAGSDVGVQRFALSAIFCDQKASATAGGTATAGASPPATRDLNTTLYAFSSEVALAANQMTLQAGTWLIEWEAPAHRCGTHRSQLWNVTAAAEAGGGSSGFSGSGASYANTQSCGSAVVALGSAATFEIRHAVGTTRATDGFGIAAALGLECYTSVRVSRMLQ